MANAKRTGTSVAIGVSFFMGIAFILAAMPAGAVVFNMGGPGSAGIDIVSTSGLFASGRDGAVTLVAQLGAVAPGGAVFSDLGVPSISPEGDVVFGGETVGQDKRPRWDIYRAKPGAPAVQRIVQALDGASIPDDCRPRFKTDPYPIAGPHGTVVFLAPEASGKDALFRLVDGHLSCATRIGDRTAQGHRIHLLMFGSADVANNGDIAFLAKVDDNGSERESVLTFDDRSRLQEVAREGASAPGGGSFEARFGRPAIVNSQSGDLIAFTNRNAKVDTVYVGSAGKLARVFRTGMRTKMGALTFISDGRPGLLSDGTLIISGAMHDRSAIFRSKDGRFSPIKTQGDLTQYGTRLESFVDPSVTSSGLVYIGGHDDSGQEHLFVFESGDASKIPVESNADISATGRWMPPFFPGSLAVNRNGDLTALGTAPDAQEPSVRSVTFGW